MRLVAAVLIAILVVAGITFVVLTRGSSGGAKRAGPEVGDPVFVGRAACAACHADQLALWEGSHHDLAMDVANEDTVLGDFDDAAMVYNGVTSSFSRRDDRFVVRTDGPDGAMAEYDVAYTFGVTPLQQYLVAWPGGRYQVAPAAWDTRPAADGGQRWFHLYPDESVDHTDPLHWTGPNQNWNFMCAECHSTDLEKGYDPATDSYHTTWSEIDVSCEACHGPGSVHVRRAEAGAIDPGESGLVVRLRNHDGGGWHFAPGEATATRTVPRTSNPQVEACGGGPARRGVSRADYVHGRPLLDTHRPSLLVEPLYEADGQIHEEVYVYGSFLQSAMYAAGVTCSDCHEPHRGEVRAPGNALCLQCHMPNVFNTPSHHFHEAGGAGSACVDCHMPARTYMQVDPRRDHSFRIPRPDLSVRLGTPNACTGCHEDQPAAWAAAAVAKWYGDDRPAQPHYGEALHAGRTNAPGAADALARLAGDASMPGIARATALGLLPRYPSAETLAAATRALTAEDPLVRVAAVAALAIAPDAERVALAFPRLEDPVLAVRTEAARVLARVPGQLLTPPQRQAVAAGIEAYVAAEMTNADRPEAHLNIGVVRTDQGRYADAEAAYRRALQLDPALIEANVNLADLYRLLRRDAEGEAVLRGALERTPDAAILHHVLGLLLVRTERREASLAALARACELGPETPRYAYVHAIALDATGRRAEARSAVDVALRRHPRDADLLELRASLTR